MSAILFPFLTCILLFTMHGAASSHPPLQPFPPPPPPSSLSNSKHFVLVHGACHGAWSWYKLLPLLRSSGYNVTALDLAASGIDPRQVSDVRSVTDYGRPLSAFMASLPRNERVILVGHSAGGLAIALIMEEFPDKVAAAVFLAALMPGPTFNASTILEQVFNGFGPQLDNRLTFNNGSTTIPTALTFGPQFLSARMYQLSPVEDLALATTLMRASLTFLQGDLSRAFVLSEKRYGSVKRVFISAGKDLILTKDIQQWMIRNNPPNETVEILGSDHMAMMSKPFQLCAHLIKIAQKYN